MRKPTQRKGNKKRRKAIINASLPSASKRPLHIKRHSFAHLKKNEDFLAIVKVGRLVNAVAFGMQALHDYVDNNSPVGKRQRNRATFITGGYLYEGLELVASLRRHYHMEKYFDELKHLTYSEEYILERRILKEMRNIAAFHLDSDDKSTRSAMANLKLTKYELASGETSRIADFYFNFADTVDLNRIIDVIKRDESEEEVVQYISRTLTTFMPRFIRGGHDFLEGLSIKIKLSDYTA